jgi:hypothetical protein
MRMTSLPEEGERFLCRFPQSTLLKILKFKSKVVAASDSYTLIQEISKAYTEAALAKAIQQFHADLDKDEDGKVYTLQQQAEDRAIASAPKAPRAPKDPNTRPQQVINAKTAIAKASGGSITYSRAHKGWLVTKADGTELVWTSEQFRNYSEQEITTLI